MHTIQRPSRTSRLFDKATMMILSWYAVTRTLCYILVSSGFMDRYRTIEIVAVSCVFAVAATLATTYRPKDDLVLFRQEKEAAGEFEFERMFKLTALFVAFGLFLSACYGVIVFVKTSLSELELAFLFFIPCMIALYLRRGVTVARSTMVLYREL